MATPAGGALPGWSSLAINWWLLNVGLNPGSPGFDPDASRYTDVTIWNRILVQPDYENPVGLPNLLGELSRCQYVNVSWEIPGQSIGHEMTLVGGNNAATPVPNNVSVWHDDRGDLTPPPGDDDEYGNFFVGAGRNGPGAERVVTDIARQASASPACAAAFLVLLCQLISPVRGGLPRPPRQVALRQLAVAWEGHRAGSKGPTPS